jgi:hypothetical protein
MRLRCAVPHLNDPVRPGRDERVMSKDGPGCQSIDPCTEGSLGVEVEKTSRPSAGYAASSQRSAEPVDHQIFARSLALDSPFPSSSGLCVSTAPVLSKCTRSCLSATTSHISTTSMSKFNRCLCRFCRFILPRGHPRFSTYEAWWCDSREHLTALARHGLPYSWCDSIENMVGQLRENRGGEERAK